MHRSTLCCYLFMSNPGPIGQLHLLNACRNIYKHKVRRWGDPKNQMISQYDLLKDSPLHRLPLQEEKKMPQTQNLLQQYLSHGENCSTAATHGLYSFLLIFLSRSAFLAFSLPSPPSSKKALNACQWSKVIKLLSKVYLTVNG